MTRNARLSPTSAMAKVASPSQLSIILVLVAAIPSGQAAQVTAGVAVLRRFGMGRRARARECNWPLDPRWLLSPQEPHKWRSVLDHRRQAPCARAAVVIVWWRVPQSHMPRAAGSLVYVCCRRHGGISLVFMPDGRHGKLDSFRGAVSGELVFRGNPKNTGKTAIYGHNSFFSRFCLFCSAKQAKTSPVRRLGLSTSLNGGFGVSKPENLASFNGTGRGGGVDFFARPA